MDVQVVASGLPDDQTMIQGSASAPRSSTTLSVRSKSPIQPSPAAELSHLERWIECCKFTEDYRGRLPLNVSRFLGYRPPTAVPPFEPLPFPPFTWLKKIPLRYEVWIFAWIGSFCSILLIEAIMSTSTVFRDVYHAPIIITSFGASAVLAFGVIESPLAQPKNLVLGQFVSALVSVAITRLFLLSPSYTTQLDNTEFSPLVFVNGALCMSTSLLAELILGIAHPPGGATGLGAAVEPAAVKLSWHYIPVILASTLTTLGWALIINNLGRRRYPIYWWSPEVSFVSEGGKYLMRESEDDTLKELEEGKLRQAEDGGRTAEALYMERMYTQASGRSRRNSRGSSPDT